MLNGSENIQFEEILYIKLYQYYILKVLYYK